MALGKRRRERQLEAFVVASDLPKSPGHPFYTALNRLRAENTRDVSRDRTDRSPRSIVTHAASKGPRCRPRTGRSRVFVPGRNRWQPRW